MTFVHSFKPVSDESATKLVLGSMPGKVSLDSNQYYAHPRNCFWRIIESTLNIPSQLPYEDRCTELTRHGIALWDVLKACNRSSSLDSDIVKSSIVPNDFGHFLGAHPKIVAVYFNGKAAEKMYMKHVVPSIPIQLASITAVRLPSTSPANASITFEAKLALWRTIRDDV